MIFPPNRSLAASATLPQVVAEFGAHRPQIGAAQVRDPLGERLARQEAGPEQAQLTAGHHHHLGSGPAQCLGPFRAVGPGDANRGAVQVVRDHLDFPRYLS